MDDDDFIKLVKLINGAVIKSYAEIENEKEVKKSNFFGGIGIAAGGLHITSMNAYWNGMGFSRSYSPVAYLGYHVQGGRQMPRFALNILLSSFYFSATGKYNWKTTSGQDETETMKYSYFDLSISPELLFSLVKNNSLSIGGGFKITYPIGVSNPYTTTEINPATGNPLYRDQLNMGNTPRAYWYGVFQYKFIKRNALRLSVAPSEKVEDTGSTNVSQQIITFSYQFTFRK